MLDNEREYIDLMTDMGYSCNLLETLSVALLPEYRDIKVEHLYGMWLEKNGLSEIISPYNFGAVIGELYVGLVFAKEIWIDLLPDIPFDEIDEKYGIKTTDYSFPQKVKPKLRDVVRRLRNSLSHSNFKIELSNVKSYPKLFNEAYIVFHDENPRDETDTFDMRLKVKQLKIFYCEFRNIIFDHITELIDEE